MDTRVRDSRNYAVELATYEVRQVISEGQHELKNCSLHHHPFSPQTTFPPGLKPTMADRVTRASNANAHPGIVDCPSKRRSKQEVEMAKKEKARAKAQAERQKTASIQRVAELESAAKQKTRDMEQEGNNPVDKMTQPQAKRTRVQPENINKGNIYHHGRWLTDEAMTWNLVLTRRRRNCEPPGRQKKEEGGFQHLGGHKSKEW